MLSHTIPQESLYSGVLARIACWDTATWNRPEAFTVAERIRTRVSEHVFAGNEELWVTCSLGVATYPQTATERERLLICADQAMYEAKYLGRNHTCLAEPTKDTHAESDTGEG